jgi:DNA invertase Pin-like site-specific DNA recombinase
MSEERQPMPPDQAISTAYAYIRVSHRNSAESGLSAGAQLDICRNYYLHHVQESGVKWWGMETIPDGLNLDRFRDDVPLLYDPAVSARHVPFLDRRGGARLGAMLKRGDHVIFSHLDRAFRALLDYAALINLWKGMGIKVHYADMNMDLQTPEGMALANMMAVFAQAQSDFLSRRCQETARRLRKLGRPRNGETPLGQKIIRGKHGATYAIDWKKRGYMAEIVRLHDEGVSFPNIARLLNRHYCKVKGVPYQDSAWSKYRVWKAETCRNCYYAWKEMVAKDPSIANHPTVANMRGSVPSQP